MPILVHDQAQESKAAQDVRTGAYCNAQSDDHGIWLPVFAPGASQIRDAINLWQVGKPKSCAGTPKTLLGDLAPPSNSSQILLAFVVSCSLLSLLWALAWKHLGPDRRFQYWPIALCVLFSGAVGASIYLYLHALGAMAPLYDIDTKYAAGDIVIGTLLFVGILKLDLQQLPWARISAGFFVVTGVLLFVNYRFAQHRAEELNAEGISYGGNAKPVPASITPGFVMVSTSPSSLTNSPSYYFRFSTSSDQATAGDTFQAFLNMFYHKGDFANDETLVQAQNLKSPQSIEVPRCDYSVSATLGSPTFTTRRAVLGEPVSIGPVARPPATATWSWLVVANPTGRQDLMLSPSLTVVGGPSGLCRSKQVFPLRPIVMEVRVSRATDFVADASVVTSSLAATAALLGVLSAVIGFVKRGDDSSVQKESTPA